MAHQLRNLNRFLEEYPLFKKFEAVTEYIVQYESYTDPFDFHGQTFNYLCPIENEIRVFELSPTSTFKEYWGKFPAMEHISSNFIDDEGKLNYIHHFEGTCTCCKKFKVDFLLHTWSDKVIPTEKIERIYADPTKDPLHKNPVNIFIEKVGEYPERITSTDKDLSKFFDRESNNWYYKAKKSLDDRFGIGAFAYFRRIIEKELIHMMKDIAKLEDVKSDKLNNLIGEYEQTNKIHLLYENTYEFLPPSLKTLGENPFKLLYKQTSKGLHNLSEEDCLIRAEAIDSLLKFVIKKIHEEKHEMKKMKGFIDSLKKDN